MKAFNFAPNGFLDYRGLHVYHISMAKKQTEQQIVYEQAGFEIYPNQKILQSYVGGKRLQKIVFCLSNVFSYKISFNDVFANIPDILRKLSRQQIKFSIVSFSVNNFRLKLA